MQTLTLLVLTLTSIVCIVALPQMLNSRTIATQQERAHKRYTIQHAEGQREVFNYVSWNTGTRPGILDDTWAHSFLDEVVSHLRPLNESVTTLHHNYNVGGVYDVGFGVRVSVHFVLARGVILRHVFSLLYAVMVRPTRNDILNADMNSPRQVWLRSETYRFYGWSNIERRGNRPNIMMAFDTFRP